MSPNEPIRCFTSLISIIFCVDVTFRCFFGNTFISHHAQHIASPRLSWFFLLVFHGIPTYFLPRGATKTLSTIKMSQNIIARSVWKDFFCFLYLNYQLQFLKTTIFMDELYFIFLENVIHQTSKAFITKFEHQWKDRRSSSQVKQIFVLFPN